MSDPNDRQDERVVYVLRDAPVDESRFIDLGELFGVLWKGKWRIALVAFVCAALGVTYALTATQWYRAEVSLLPAEANGGKGLAGQLAQLGGLASLAGINLGVGGSDKAEPLAILKSKDFVRQFIIDKQLMQVLYADKWDPQGKRWLVKDEAHIPDIRDAVKFFDLEIRNVSEDRKTGLVTLSVEWTNATTAADWANELAKRINEQTRARTLRDSQANIEYLKNSLAATDQVSLQQAISRLMESELQRVVLARGDDEIAFRIIDSAHPPKRRIRPRRPVVALAALFFGIFAGAAWVTVSAYRAGRLGGAPRRDAPADGQKQS